MNADDVLDLIDSACDDWQVGPDAMRSGGSAIDRLPASVRVLARDFEDSLARVSAVVRSGGVSMSMVAASMARMSAACAVSDTFEAE